ncbi:O-antigen ligase family protein [Mesorhizobium sp. VNQ89]|uniref:O-antigen ligase family protein n=1 Tax=Mesorhizobium quangtriensis TaxID=3157709 RepID=UPI0032B82AFB
MAWSLVQMAPIGLVIPSMQSAMPAQESVSLSIAPAATWSAFMKTFSYGVFLYLAIQTLGRMSSKFVISFIFYTITFYAFYSVTALYMLGDTILFFEKWDYLGAATGTFVNRNSFALYLGMGVVLGAALLVDSIMRYKRREIGERSEGILYLLLTQLVAAALLATQSRMGAFAAFAGLVVVLAIIVLKHNRSWQWLLAFALGLAAFSLLGFWFYGAETLQRFEVAGEAAQLRMTLYAQIVEMILQRPWTGYGGGTFEYAFPLYHQPSFATDVVWDKAHSTYLTLVVEDGILAGLATLSIFLILIARILMHIVLANEYRMAPTAAFGVIVVAAVHSTVDFGLEIQANMFTLLAIIAVGIASRANGEAKARLVGGRHAFT